MKDETTKPEALITADDVITFAPFDPGGCGRMLAGEPGDEEISEAIEREFSETGEWPNGDVAVVRAFLKHRGSV